jgi:CubicO group peptidase (beta-lactamase class C family)
MKAGIAGLLLSVATTTAVAQGLPRARPADVGLAPDSLEWIAPALRAYVESGKVPGMLAIVARHGKTVYVNSIGSPTMPGPQETAVFRIFSMTKPITSAAAMQLVERGKLRLDDPVSKYIPSFANVKVFAGGSAARPELRAPDRAITVADLLTHTSGLTYGIFDSTSVDSIYRAAGFFGPGWTTVKLADSLARLPLKFSPGTQWNYSFSTDVLGRVIEVASGQTLDRYLDSALFKPLKMTMTGFRATPAMRARVIPIYTRGADGKLQAQTPLLTPDYTTPGELLSGGGGLLSTPDDYLRFAQMLLNGGELDGKRVLKRETVALMMQNHVPDSWVPLTIAEGWAIGRSGFGYGGAVRMDSDPSVAGSAGTFRWAGYGTTFFWVDPKNNLIGMLWTQYMPVMENWALDGEFQRRVYAALVGDGRTAGRPEER